jgi:hypothetical protein
MNVNMPLKLGNAGRRAYLKDIADVLDIPKGSVDPGLYYIKHSLSHLLKDDNAEQSQKYT